MIRHKRPQGQGRIVVPRAAQCRPWGSRARGALPAGKAEERNTLGEEKMGRAREEKGSASVGCPESTSLPVSLAAVCLLLLGETRFSLKIGERVTQQR